MNSLQRASCLPCYHLFNHPGCGYIFNGQIWEWYRSSHLTLGKGANKIISQNVKPLLLKCCLLSCLKIDLYSSANISETPAKWMYWLILCTFLWLVLLRRKPNVYIVPWFTVDALSAMTSPAAYRGLSLSPSPPPCCPFLQPPPLSPRLTSSPPYSSESPAKSNFILEPWILFCQMTDRGQPGGESIGHGLSTEMHSPDQGGHLVLNRLRRVLCALRKRAELAFILM